MHAQAATVTRPSPLANILLSDVSIVTVERPLRTALARTLRTVSLGEPFARSATVDVGQPDPQHLVEPIRDPLAREFLSADITALAREFGTVLSRRHLHAQLAVVRTDSCRKYHADHVTVRLLCTYAGPGTEWVPDREVVRENLSRIDVDFDTANHSVLRRPDAVRVCEPGDVILLKGEAFEGNQGRGAVHRSPPVEAGRLSRLVLRIDEHPCC